MKKYSEIDWEEIRETRNDIAHTYHLVDPEKTWFSITEEIPVLKETCERILCELRSPKKK